MSYGGNIVGGVGHIFMLVLSKVGEDVFGENISIFPGRPGFGIKIGGSGVLSSSCKVHSPDSILQKYISTSSFAKSSQCF